MSERSHNIGVVGTGFISRGFAKSMRHHDDLKIQRVLTRRPVDSCGEYPLGSECLTNSIDDLIEHSDLIVECSGDVIHATEVVDAAVKAEKPVVTMDAEFHVTTGSYFVDKGYVTEAEGDQPGCLAALHESVVEMGFRPKVLGNVKGFHDPNPTRESMEFWSKKQGISMEMVTSATDGTKIEFEQALVANGLGADIFEGGMNGAHAEDLYASANDLAEKAKHYPSAVSDYVVIGGSPYRVFVVAEHDEDQWAALEYYKFGEGPWFVIPSTNIMCHFEIVKTIRRVLAGGSVLLNNSNAPRVSVAAIAKRDLKKGERIDHALGNFDIRGEAVKIVDVPSHAPIGLLNGAVLENSVEAGQTLSFADLSVPDSLAKTAWQEILQTALSYPPST